ncbi:DNA repair protein RecO [Methylacidimicrobium sp. B4]|uniref:DNA repair protein RecO n=1 Tax=Methylacidimicrobium sp. B4 TaxID=2796139 RepID=UPI001A8FC32D|nr:recombination protein O N-terminal domain-containing protein [Methylacidimicrobium sp. B4]QSR84249.1 DNA repair protein RecO C-terminal domain-containing protein [Methylacidimicrobium sp. B4]
MERERQTEGILLRRHSYSESSWILGWLTADLGWIHTLAKGAKKGSGGLRGPLDLFYLCEIAVLAPRTGDLYLFREARVRNPLLALRKSWATFSCAQYFGELVGGTVERGTPLPELYDLLRKALTYLEAHPPSLLLIERFERRLLEASGMRGAGLRALGELLGGSASRIFAARKRLQEALVPGG